MAGLIETIGVVLAVGYGLQVLVILFLCIIDDLDYPILKYKKQLLLWLIPYYWLFEGLISKYKNLY